MVAFVAETRAPPTALFERERGFDVYVDACRGLPDNASISKARRGGGGAPSHCGGCRTRSFVRLRARARDAVCAIRRA